MKNSILTIICCISISYMHAQKSNESDRTYRPYNPTELPAGAPAWMAELDNIDTINYHRMVERFRQFQHENPSMRTKTPYNKSILNHFYRWQKAYAPFASIDGNIRLPKQSDFVKLVDEINMHSNIQTRAPHTGVDAETEPWKVLSPIITYNSQTKQLRPWQSNVQRFDVSPTNPNIIYAGTETSMIFKSTDKGLTWKPCAPNHYFGGLISSVEVSRSNPDKVVVGGGSLVWLTTDGGDTWTNITPTELRNVYKRVRDVIIHPTNDNTFILANDMGIYKTTDNGANWTRIATGQCFDLKYKTDNPDIVYSLIKRYSGVEFCKSTNGGDIFTSRNLGYSDPLASGRIGVSEASTGREYVYVFACAADASQSYSSPFFLGTPVLFKSTDAGENWTVNTTVKDKFEPFDKNGGQGYYDIVIQPSASDPETLLFGLLNLYRSTDGGNTVQNVGGYYGKFDLHCDMQDMKVVGDDTWLSTDGGIIYSNDFFNNNAEPRINGIYASEFWGFDMGWNEDVMVGGRNHNGNMVQIDRYNGVSISVGGSECSTGYVFLSNPRKVAFSDAGSSYLPDDWKDEFVPFYGFWTFPLESSQFGIGFEYDPRYAKSFYINRRDEPMSLWKTVNDGESFVSLYTFKENVSAYAVSRANPDVIFVGTVNSIYRSDDGGKSFKNLSNLPKEMVNTLNYKIAIHPRNDKEIWVSTNESGGVFRTKDGGETWEQMNKGLKLQDTDEQQLVTRLILTGNDKNAIYAVSGVVRPLDETYRVYRSRVLYRDDTTDSWQDFSRGLPPVVTVTRMLPFYKAGELRLATNNGIWSRPLVDSDFKPIAQPIVLSAGTSENKGEAEWQFDSYSIVNQKDATWEWTFVPEPLHVDNKNIRNPKIRVAADQSYDVTLTVTTPQGSDTKTVKNMIKGSKEVVVSIAGQEVLDRDVDFNKLAVNAGEVFEIYSRGLHKTVTLTLYNSGGKLINTINIPAGSRRQITTDGLPAGVYFYVCQSSEFKKAGRLIIN